MFNRHDISRNFCQLFGGQAKLGYDWWWHSFTGRDAETGEEKPFFIEFFLCNPASGKKEPVFGQLPENQKKGIRPSYLMVKAGAWGEDAAQLHRFWGWKRIEVQMDGPLGIKADDCSLSETFTRGSVEVSLDDSYDHPEWMCQAGKMSWELSIGKKTAFNVGWGASRPMRALQLFEMFWHAEGMATSYQGVVWWNNRKYTVSPDTCYGYADKNWGKGFTTPWVWLSSCNLTSELTGKRLTDSVFDIGGGRPKIGPLVLNRKLLSAFWYEGRGFEFNFSKFWTFCRTKFDCYETDTQIVWHVEQRTWLSRMVTDVTCEKKDMLLVNYEAPNGERHHRRLWNGGNGHGTVSLYHCGKLIDRIKAENIGCEWGEYDTVGSMIHEEGYIPETYRCLGYIKGWFLVEVDGKAGFIREELIEDEEEFVEECCCHQGLSVGSLQETTDYVTRQVRRLNMIEQLPEGIRAEFISQLNQGKDPWRDKGLSDAVWRLPLQSFTSYDVETANEYPGSICSMGFIFVRNGKIADKFYTLVHPEPDYYNWRCRQVHGLEPADTDNAPNFKKAWNKIRNRIGNKHPLVAHNARFDEGCTRAAFEVYQMDYPEYQFLDTLKSSRRAFGKSIPNHQLQTSAAACGFDLRRHHNALADAEACAAIAIKTLRLADLW